MKKIVVYVVLLSVVLVFSGCTTMKAPVKAKNLESEVNRLKRENEALTAQRDAYKNQTDQIKNQVQTLQSSLAYEKQKTMELESKLKSLSSELESFEEIALYEEKPTITSSDFTKKVQMALYTAGFDPGKIDGKMGQQTIQAIKKFQQDMGLKVDGIVGRETWDILQRYLETK